jgi:hypothetical protein
LSYDSITPASGGLSQIVENGKCGIIDDSGKTIVKPELDWIDSYHEGKAIITSHGRYGFINTKGEIKYMPEFDKIYAFSEGLARVQKGSKWGFINENGDTIIDTVFDSASDFSQGYAAVKKNTGSAGIEDSGDAALIKKYIKWGYIDRLGSTFISYDFDSASPFDGDTALVLQDNKCSTIKISDIKSMQSLSTADPYKVWKIKFSKPIDDKAVKNEDDDTVINNIDMTMTDNIKVTDKNGKYVDVSFSLEAPNVITINPPYEGYETSQDYTITILSNNKYNIRDKDGNILKPSIIEIPFSIVN